MTGKTKVEEAQEQVQQVYKDKEATLPSGKTYVLTKMTHINRRTVFAFFTHIQDDLRRGDLWFLTSPEWAKVEAILFNVITVDDSLLSKKPDHWDEYPEDYILFIQTMLPVVSYPFMRGVTGG
jgi:predicted SnoaL-like aldol condensation-catalyzing enzyme